MTETAKQHSASVTSLGTDRTRRYAQLAHRVDELEALLADYAEREHVQELEIAALLRDLELKAMHNTMLDRSIEDERRHGEWLQQRLDAEAEAHRQACARAGEVQELLEGVRAELEAERARASYRIIARVLTTLDRHPRLLALVLRLARRGAATDL